MNKQELIGKPEVTRKGVERKNTRNKEPAGKLVVDAGKNGAKYNILLYSSVVKDIVITAGIAYGWEDLATTYPVNHYFVSALLGLGVATYLTFKFSKIR